MQNQQLIKYKNPVILKDEAGKQKSKVGKTKLSIYDLPAENHTYGKKVVDDPEPMKYGKAKNKFSGEWMEISTRK